MITVGIAICTIVSGSSVVNRFIPIKLFNMDSFAYVHNPTSVFINFDLFQNNFRKVQRIQIWLRTMQADIPYSFGGCVGLLC